MHPLIRTVLIALVLAIVVALVFSVVTAVAEYSGIAGLLLTFLLVLISGWSLGRV